MAEIPKMRSIVIRKTKHQPLKTFDEIAEMLKVSSGSLRKYMRWHDGPSPVILKRGNTYSSQSSYYSPSEMKKWFAQVQEKIKK